MLRPHKTKCPCPCPHLTQHIARRPSASRCCNIAEEGSITRAAKAAGISYKAAWDAIDELNNLASQPLVERSTGGRGGGGARLSPEGQRVLRLYQRLQALQAQILEAAEESSDLDLLGRLMLRTSARNQLQGQVSGLRREGRHDRVSLALGGGLEIEALITHDSTARLELTLGTTVVALLKAGWVRLLADEEQAEADSNCLRATVEEVLAEADGPGEVRLALGNGQTLCAFAETDWLAGQRVAAGSSVRVQFHPSYVLLGIPA
nr:TOBE domain-containing protein [Pseudomonas asiatica]